MPLTFHSLHTRGEMISVHFNRKNGDNKCKTTCMKVTTSLWYKWTQHDLIVNLACAAHVLEVLSRMVLQKLVGAKPFTPPQILWFVNSKGGISLQAAEENKLQAQVSRGCGTFELHANI